MFFDSVSKKFVAVEKHLIWIYKDVQVAALLSLPETQIKFLLEKTYTFHYELRYQRIDPVLGIDERSIFVSDPWIGEALLKYWNHGNGDNVRYEEKNI